MGGCVVVVVGGDGWGGGELVQDVMELSESNDAVWRTSHVHVLRANFSEPSPPDESGAVERSFVSPTLDAAFPVRTPQKKKKKKREWNPLSAVCRRCHGRGGEESFFADTAFSHLFLSVCRCVLLIYDPSYVLLPCARCVRFCPV